MNLKNNLYGSLGLIILISLMFGMGIVTSISIPWGNLNVNNPAYWKLDEGSGTSSADAVYNHIATLQFGAGWANGKLVKGLLLNGSNYANVTDSNDLDATATQSFSVCTWINMTNALSGGLWEGIITKYDGTTGWQLRRNNDNRTMFIIRDGTFEPSITLGPIVRNQWYHVCGVRDVVTDKVYIYLDGVQNSTADTTTATLANAVEVKIGSFLGNNFTGVIDEVGFWNRSLTQTEVNYLYNSGNGLPYNSTYETDIIENSQTFNPTTYETYNENFNINFTYDNSFTLNKAYIVYNGTSYLSSVLGNSTNSSASRNLQIPILTSGTIRNFYWNISLINSTGIYYYQSTTNTQTIYPTSLGLCNATLNVSYINFTFKDEALDTYITATMDLATWTYSLGTTTKSLIVTNTTTNPSYAFCFSPSDKPISETLTFQYANTGYPQRQYYRSGTLTNSTTNQVLYLLGSGSGIYSTFVTSSSSNAPISGVIVQIERQFAGTWTLITQGTSDSAGSATFWLNPNYDHRITATKTGYTSTTITLKPTQSIYTIIMGGGVSNATYSNILEGMTYSISPRSGFLDSNTTYKFEFNISANLGNLVSYKMDLELINGTILSSTIGTEPYGSNLSVDFNTGNYETIYGKYYIDIGTGYYLIDPSIWSLRNITTGEGSIYDAIKKLINYRTNIEDNYGQLWWLFFLAFVLLSVLCYSTGAELSNPGIVLIPLFLFVITFSYMGFFTIDFSPNSFMNKYGIAMVSFFLTGGYIMSRFQS